jgi:hypothetical protein
MQLGDIWLSTAPHEPRLHWSSAFLPLDPPLQFTAGETVRFKLQRPPFADWSWQVETNQTKQIHSTFFGRPITLSTIQKTALDYQPRKNMQGEAALYVLSQSDGTVSVEDLGHALLKNYPHLFPSLQKAIRFVQDLVGRFS